MSDIISTLEMMCTDVWIEKNSTNYTTDKYRTNRNPVSDNVDMYMYFYSNPIIVIRTSESDNLIHLTYNEKLVYISIKNEYEVDIYLPMNLSEEQFFQQSLIEDFSWLTYEMYVLGTIACCKHCEKYKNSIMESHD